MKYKAAHAYRYKTLNVSDGSPYIPKSKMNDSFISFFIRDCKGSKKKYNACKWS